MRIIVVSPKNKSVFNFRGDLIKDMISRGHEVIVTGPNRDYVQDIMDLGVSEFVEVSLVKDNVNAFGDLTYYKKLKKVFKEKKPDLVFTYTIKPNIYGCLAAKSAKVPNIYAMLTGLGRVYASDSLKVKAVRFVVKMLYKRALKACEKVIFQNRDDIKDFVSQNYLPLEKCVQVNGSGVNMDRFFRTELPEEPIFIMVSRIIREKGIFEFCEAARKVKKQHPEARFILLGGFDSSIGAITPEEIQGYIDDGSIEHPGEVKDPVSFFQRASVFVLPSYYREGIPRTVLEAMSCGRGIITTDWPGCREPIESGVNGFLIPPKDADALAEKMTVLIEDSELLKSMADAAYNTCKERYEVGKVNDTMREALKY